jgi:FkbM family methyltransferase
MSYVPDLVYDVGLHMGEDTEFYLKKGYRVIAFEADPLLADLCRKRFCSHIAAGQLKIVEGAIVRNPEGGPITFYRDQNTVWGTVNPDWADRNRYLGSTNAPIHVEPVDMVRAFRDYGIPYYLKVDIEGSDRVVFELLLGMGVSPPPHASIEAEKVSFPRLVDEMNLLAELGYRKFRPVQQRRLRAMRRKYHRIITTDRQGNPVEHSFDRHGSGPFADDLVQPWLSFDDCILEYERIFRAYRLFGDRSPLMRVWGARRLSSIIEHLWRKPLPGWYDTHAAL